MLLLDAASKLQLTASVAGSLDYTVSKIRNGTPFLPVPTKGNIAVNTATDICAVPGGTDIDTVEMITVNNVHASVITDVEVTHVGGSTVRVFKVKNLAPGESITMSENGVVFVFTTDGKVKSEGNSPYDSKGVDVTSAATLVLGAGSFFHITGTTGITDIDFAESWDGRTAKLVFDGSLTITHNATTLILPGAQNITTGPGDSCTVVVDSGDNVRVVQYERALGVEVTNPGTASIANQSIGAATTAYIADSAIPVPPSGLRVRTVLRWAFSVEKTAAGTAANTFTVRLGTLGTTGDATILTFALPVGTAVADKGRIDIEVIIRGPLGASCVASGLLVMTHNLAATGLSTLPVVVVQVVSGTFNSSTAALIAGLACTTAASTVLNFQQASANSVNL